MKELLESQEYDSDCDSQHRIELIDNSDLSGT